MHGATHLTWGMAAGLTAGLLVGAPTPGNLMLATGIGGLAGLLPDWLQVNLPGASKQIRGAFGHRGFSHWLWTPLALIFVAQAFYTAPVSLVAAFLCGWVSHIILDALADGVPAFWPFGRLTLAHIRTGGQGDKLFGGAGLVMTGLGIWRAVAVLLAVVAVVLLPTGAAVAQVPHPPTPTPVPHCAVGESGPDCAPWRPPLSPLPTPVPLAVVITPAAQPATPPTPPPVILLPETGDINHIPLLAAIAGLAIVSLVAIWRVLQGSIRVLLTLIVIGLVILVAYLL
jgi:hypothetical protein